LPMRRENAHAETAEQIVGILNSTSMQTSADTTAKMTGPG
jgi:hypothetical protein